MIAKYLKKKKKINWTNNNGIWIKKKKNSSNTAEFFCIRLLLMQNSLTILSLTGEQPAPAAPPSRPAAPLLADADLRLREGQPAFPQSRRLAPASGARTAARTPPPLQERPSRPQSPSELVLERNRERRAGAKP